MESKTGTLVRAVVLVLVAVGSSCAGFFLGFMVGIVDMPHSGLGRGPNSQDGPIAFFEGLCIGILLFVLLAIVLLWHSHQMGVRARCEELTCRVDKLQRELMDLRAATERPGGIL